MDHIKWKQKSASEEQENITSLYLVIVQAANHPGYR